MRIPLKTIACACLFLPVVSISGAELKVDHVTVAGTDLRKMRDALSAIGIPSEPGGPHSNHATEMALTSFPDGSYLELIAIQRNADPQAVADHYWTKFLTGDGGPCAWAIHVPDVNTEARRLRAAGISVSRPAKSGRTRPDGVDIAWEVANVGPGPNGTFFPFMIRDSTPRPVRAYPSGKPTTSEFSGIAYVVLGVKNLGESIQLFRRAYDLPAPKLQKDPEFGAELAFLKGAPVILAAPLSPNSWLAERINRFGNAPCAFILASESNRTSARTSIWFGKTITWFDASKLGWHLGSVAVH